MEKSYLLSAINPLISVILFATFFFLWQRRKQSRHVLDWALAYACAAVGLSLDLARAFVANAVPFSFVANLFFLAVGLFVCRGALVRYCGRSFASVIVPVYIVTVCVGSWFTLIDPSVMWRGTAASAGGALMLLLTARAIWKEERVDRIGRLTAWAFTLSAITLLARPVASYLYEGALSQEQQVASSFWIVSFKIFAMLSWFTFAILFFLRVTSDLMEELSVQSITDALTGIPNRRGFFDKAVPILQQTDGYHVATLAICDIDHFKRINDRYGHRMGDRVIQRFAKVLEKVSEDVGCIIGRIGGEEFVALLPNTNAAGARVFAEGLRVAFENQALEGLSPSEMATVSIGIAELSRHESIDDLIERADAALYRAKQAGRNRVEVAVPFGAISPDYSRWKEGHELMA